MANRLFKHAVKYCGLTALYFIVFSALTLIVSGPNSSFMVLAEEQTQSQVDTEDSRRRAEYFENFHFSLMRLEEWSPAKITDEITESEIGFSIGIAELSEFARTLQQAMFTSETREQKDMVHRFAVMMEKKQRLFLTQARLFSERRLNHYLGASEVKAYVPPIRNTTIEIHGANLDIAENRQSIIRQYRPDLYLARFKKIIWKTDPNGEPVSTTRISSFGDESFIIERTNGANSAFSYQH